MHGKEGFKKFYRANFKMSEQDYQNFVESLERPLPRTFRSMGFCGEINTDNLPLLLDAGLVYAQEVVSALPCSFLQLSPAHLVLDMCAAPGSKTTQMASQVRLLVANDSSASRCSVLISNLKKTPSTGVVVTGHDARLFPMIRLAHTSFDSLGFPLYFDRILCDVPCSSDGTIRKNRKALDNWHVNTMLFSLQYEILQRAGQLLKADGLIVYSTCSLSPIENEAVVQKFCAENSFEIVDCSRIFNIEVRSWSNKCMSPNENRSGPSVLPENMYRITDDESVTAFCNRRVVFREGLTHWNPFVERTEHTADLFPQDCKALKHCLRVMPHDQDTGGFFITVLRRRVVEEERCGVIPQMCEADVLESAERLRSVLLSRECKNASNSRSESCVASEPCYKPSHRSVKFFPIENTLDKLIRKYYGLDTSDLLVTRSRIVRCVSPLAFLVSASPRLKVLSAGVKAFEQSNFSSEKACSYKISFEYAQIVWRSVQRVVHVSKEEFQHMMDGFWQLQKDVGGCVIFVHRSFACPGFANNKRGVLLIKKQVKRALKKALDWS
eukprot:jgi/Antlo1/735/372